MAESTTGRSALRAGEDRQPTASGPPEGLPRYRLLTGPDDEAFCRRVSAALDLGFVLHGSPAAAARADGQLLVAQAVIWPSNAAPQDVAGPAHGHAGENS